MKWQATDREKIFAKHISDKGLVSKLDNELLITQQKKTIQLKNEQKI